MPHAITEEEFRKLQEIVKVTDIQPMSVAGEVHVALFVSMSSGFAITSSGNWPAAKLIVNDAVVGEISFVSPISGPQQRNEYFYLNHQLHPGMNKVRVEYQLWGRRDHNSIGLHVLATVDGQPYAGSPLSPTAPIVFPSLPFRGEVNLDLDWQPSVQVTETEQQKQTS